MRDLFLCCKVCVFHAGYWKSFYHRPINKAVHGILCHHASSVFVTNGQMMPSEIFTSFNKGGGIVIRPKNIPLFCSWIMQQGAATWPSRRRWCQKETGIYLNTELLILFALPSCPPISFVFVFLFNLYFGFHLQNEDRYPWILDLQWLCDQELVLEPNVRHGAAEANF